MIDNNGSDLGVRPLKRPRRCPPRALLRWKLFSFRVAFTTRTRTALIFALLIRCVSSFDGKYKERAVVNIIASVCEMFVVCMFRVSMFD